MDTIDTVAELVERARSGKLEAFDELVQRYQDVIFGAAFGMLGNAQDAEDLAQQTFLQAWRELGTLRVPATFPSWLYRIAQNGCRNFLSRARQPTVPLDAVEAILSAPDDAAETADAVRQAIASLSEPNRVATTLFYLSGYRVAEIAVLLEVPAGTVKRRLHDARRQLEAQLLGPLKEELESHRPSQSAAFAQLIGLVNAACGGHAARMQSLLETAPLLVEARDHEGWTPLHHAARHGHLPVVDLLLTHGADPEVKDATWGWTPLHLAVMKGHREVAAALRRSGASPSIVASAGLGDVDGVAALLEENPALVQGEGTGSTPLHWAAYRDRLAVVELLLNAGADIHARSLNEFQNTALHCAVLGRHVEVVRLLLARGADPRAIDGLGATPLHALAKYPQPPSGREEAVLLVLLRHGAEIDMTNPSGETALHWAATRGSREVAGLLITHAADLDVFAAAGLDDVTALEDILATRPGLVAQAGPDGMTALHFAAYGDATLAARALLSHGAAIDQAGGWFGGTPLHLAAYQGNASMVELLLEQGAEARATDAGGWTPLHQFRFPWWTPPESDRSRIAAQLLARGANIQAQTATGKTPLHAAAERGHLSLVSCLLQHGADPGSRDADERTPLDCAIAQRHFETAERLLRAGAGLQTTR